MQHIDKICARLELAKYSEIKAIKTLAAKTKLKPEHISLLGLVLLSVFFLLTSWGNKILMVALTFLYPSYKSFAALESADSSDDKRWLTYWVVFGIVSAFKDILLYVFSFVPGFNLLITVGLFSLYCPLTRFYVQVYEFVFRPLLKTYQGNIKKYIDMAKEEMADKLKKGKNVVVDELVK